MPSSLAKIAMSIPLIVGGHSLGHVNAGDEKGYRVDIHPSTLSEKIIPNYRGEKGQEAPVMPDNADRSYIEGGGIAGQDKLADTLGPESNLVNAIYKIGYLFGFPDLVTNEPGDFRRMEQFKGHTAKKVMQGAVLASAIEDLYKAKTGKGLLGKNSDLKFWTSDTGAPGLLYSKRF